MTLGDIEKHVLSELERMFPGVDKKYVRWKQLKTLDRHLLVLVSRHRGDDVVSDTRFLAIDASGTVLHLGSVLQYTNTEGLLVLLREEKLQVEKRNCAEIIELFALMHPQKRVLTSSEDLDQPGIRAVKAKQDKIKQYDGVIQPFLFDENDYVRTVTFWTIDFWTGDLEQWELLQSHRGKIHIESEVLEPGLIGVLF